MARIVVTTVGSRGDLYPMLPVAARLRERGHDLVFAVPESLAGDVTREGFDCSSVTMPEPPAQVGSGSPEVLRAWIADSYPSMLRQAVVVLQGVSSGADLIVTNQVQVAAAIAGRKLGIRWVTLTVFPGFIPSGHTVPQPHWLPALPTPAGRAINRLTWRIFEFGLRHTAGDSIREAVVANGLKPDNRVFAPGSLSPYLTLVLSSPVYSPRQPDWPASVKVTGHSAWDVPHGWVDPEGLDEFLRDQSDPPVLVIASTSLDRDAGAFFRSAAQALTLSKRRGLLIGRGSDIEGDRSHLRSLPYLPLSRVVDRCALVVHHAGIGTTITTLRHGRPAIAVPATFDQWYNASRVKFLGIGRVIEWKRFTAERLASEIAVITRSPNYGRQAQLLGAAIATEDGAAFACDEIESLLN